MLGCIFWKKIVMKYNVTEEIWIYEFFWIITKRSNGKCENQYNVIWWYEWDGAIIDYIGQAKDS